MAAVSEMLIHEDHFAPSWTPFGYFVCFSGLRIWERLTKRHTESISDRELWGDSETVSSVRLSRQGTPRQTHTVFRGGEVGDGYDPIGASRQRNKLRESACSAGVEGLVNMAYPENAEIMLEGLSGTDRVDALQRGHYLNRLCSRRADYTTAPRDG